MTFPNLSRMYFSATQLSTSERQGNFICRERKMQKGKEANVGLWPKYQVKHGSYGSKSVVGELGADGDGWVGQQVNL